MTPPSRTGEAAVLVEPAKALRMMTLTIPQLRPGQILVRVAYSGVCGSQLLEARGGRGPDPFLPHTLGHEGSGTVVEIGSGVTKVKPGDRVVLSWMRGSGAEIRSTVYGGPHGPVNSGAIASLMTQTVTCESRATRIPPDMPLRDAALFGCAIPTGFGAVLNFGRVRPGSSVAVFGVGGVGLSAIVAASMVSATPIVAVDLFDHKLNRARDLGASQVVNARQADPVDAILQVTGGRGVDCAIEAAGTREAMERAFAATRSGGGLCVLAGNLRRGERMSLDPFDLIGGKRLVGTWGGESRPDEDIPGYVALSLSGKLKPSELITHEYRLDDINRALDDIEAGRVGRALIAMNDE